MCDKGEPNCQKCIKKGIECSGQSRVRFAEGVARRGFLRGSKIPDTKIAKQQEEIQILPSDVSYSEIRWQKNRKQRTRVKLKEEAMRARSGDSIKLLGNSLPASERQLNSIMRNDQYLTIESIETQDGDETVDKVIQRSGLSGELSSRSQHVIQWIAPFDPEIRMLFSYCKFISLHPNQRLIGAINYVVSDAIAPVMVVLDDVTNGYRSLILSMAMEDEVLRRAVSVVAAQHLNRERPELKIRAEANRRAVISRLRSQSLTSSIDIVFNEFTWATLIVLLVGETVTGSEDYSFLVRMLLCLSAHSKKYCKNSIAMKFLETQSQLYCTTSPRQRKGITNTLHRFELLSLPLLGENIGVLTIKKAFDWMLDWFSFSDLPADCEDRQVTDMIRQCFASACAIYVRCASRGSSSSSHYTASFPRANLDPIHGSNIERIIELMSRISPGARGAHALVWVCFIAGADTNDPVQRVFFLNYLNEIYARTQFHNIPAAVRSLENIWARNRGERWTQSLPQLSKVLVM